MVLPGRSQGPAGEAPPAGAQQELCLLPPRSGGVLEPPIGLTWIGAPRSLHSCPRTRGKTPQSDCPSCRLLRENATVPMSQHSFLLIQRLRPGLADAHAHVAG